MLLLQALIVSVPLIVALIIGLIIIWPDTIFVFAVLNSLMIFYTIWQFCRSSKVDTKWYNYLSTPVLFHVSTLLFLTLISGWDLTLLVFGLNVFYLYFYLRILYYFLIKPTSYQENSLENISLLGTLLIFFFLAVSGFGFNSFLEVSIWKIIFGFALLNFLAYYQILSINRVDSKKIILFSLFNAIAIVEISWSLSFLPIKYYIAGFILALIDYVMLALTRLYLLNRLNSKIIKLYIILGLTCLIIVLFTARWL